MLVKLTPDRVLRMSTTSRHPNDNNAAAGKLDIDRIAFHELRKSHANISTLFSI